MDAALRRERLENLMRVGKSIPMDALWMGKWWAGEQRTSCGTAGCLIGYAAHDPYFNGLGLSIRPGFTVPEVDGERVPHGLEDMLGLSRLELDSLIYASRYLGVSDYDALCKQGVSATREQVLDRIQALIDATPKPVALPAPEAQGAAR